jgi:hypothetical protein
MPGQSAALTYTHRFLASRFITTLRLLNFQTRLAALYSARPCTLHLHHGFWVLRIIVSIWWIRKCDVFAPFGDEHFLKYLLKFMPVGLLEVIDFLW